MTWKVVFVIAEGLTQKAIERELKTRMEFKQLAELRGAWIKNVTGAEATVFQTAAAALYSMPLSEHGLENPCWGDTFGDKAYPCDSPFSILGKMSAPSGIFMSDDPMRFIVQSRLTTRRVMMRPCYDEHIYHMRNEFELTKRALDFEAFHAPDLIMMHYAYPALAKKRFGEESEEYREAVLNVQTNMGMLSSNDGLGDRWFRILLSLPLEEPGERGGASLILNGFRCPELEPDASVSLYDIAPTIADFIGIKPDPAWHGHSLFKVPTFVSPQPDFKRLYVPYEGDAAGGAESSHRREMQ